MYVPNWSSYFDKSAFNRLIREAVEKENFGNVGFYYINSKKANTLLQGSGYQLPQKLASRISASDTIIRHISENINRKISHFTESQQFKRWFGKSKVVNEDGTPKVVYHGTPIKGVTNSLGTCHFLCKKVRIKQWNTMGRFYCTCNFP